MEMILLMKNEMLLALLLAVLLIIRIKGDHEQVYWIRLMLGMMFVVCIAGWIGNTEGSMFDSMYITSPLIAFQKNALNTGTLIILLFSSGWFRRLRHLPEFFMLMTTALMGMSFMVSSGNLLMFYLALEMSTIPIAAMCNFNLADRRSSEAAMKMIFSSAFSSCIMLLGISFIYGATGTLNFQEISAFGDSPVFLAGFVFFFAGLVFKLSVVPFHFWTADVYEGSPVAVTAFLSVISKGAMVFAFANILYHAFSLMHREWYLLLSVLSMLTIVIGNLFALRQENLKRFLAFSSISQVGFILIGISGYANDGLASSIYFVVVYVFSNLAAFAVVSVVSELSGRETISQYKGLSENHPGLAWTMAIALFSLAGIPPTAGFFGKFFLLASGAAKGNYILISIAALNMMVSLYYYLRVIRAMFMDARQEPMPNIVSGNGFKVAVVICIAGIMLTGLVGSVYQYIYLLGAK